MKLVMPEWGTLTMGDIDMSGLSKLGDLTVLEYPSTEELRDALEDADALLVNKTIVTEDLLSKAKKLRYIGECATGYNNIDLGYCNAHGITVTNVPAYSTSAVAQQTFSYLLEFYNKTHDYNELVQEGGWINSASFSRFVYPTAELEGKTMGLVGYGQIGKKVAQIAVAFGMRVLAYSRSALAKQEPCTDPGVTFVPLDTLLEQSDVVSVHCPLNEDSEKLFNEETFQKMKQDAFFINTARGPIVEETALVKALTSGHLAGAGLDVLVAEPMSPDCPLRNIPNCIITPHVGWAPMETRQRLVNIVCENLTAFLQGNPQNVVTE